VLLGAARRDPAVAAEFEASVPHFFAATTPLSDPQSAWLAARRHAEWFLIERHSPTLRGAPAERLLDPLRQSLTDAEGLEPELLELAIDGVLSSATGAFLVEEVRVDEGAWLRDISGLATYALAAPELARRLQVGDLVVGRLSPIGDGLHVPSPAAGVFRGPEIVGALERDLAELRSGPGAKVLRLAQLELERMFFGALHRDASVPRETSEPTPGISVAERHEVIAEARRWFAERGLDEALAEALLERLAFEPPTPGAVTPGRGDALGEVLAELAFESEVDLELARAKLLQIWQVIGARTQAPEERGEDEPHDYPDEDEADGPDLDSLQRDAEEEEATEERTRRPRNESDARTSHREAPKDDEERARVVDEFARKRAAGNDAASEVAALREALGLDESDDDEEDQPAPDFPGVVGAMVHEFVWETSVTEGEASARELAPLAHLATFAEPIGVFEELGAKDLVRFASFWVIERGVVRDAAAARALLGALRRFGDWCRSAHEHDVMETFGPALDGLVESLPRVIEANNLVAVPGNVRNQTAQRDTDEDLAVGDVFEVADDTAQRFVDLEGEERPLEVEPRLRARLATGDRVRGRVEAGVLKVLRVYPPEAALAR